MAEQVPQYGTPIPANDWPVGDELYLAGITEHSAPGPIFSTENYTVINEHFIRTLADNSANSKDILFKILEHTGIMPADDTNPSLRQHVREQVEFAYENYIESYLLRADDRKHRTVVMDKIIDLYEQTDPFEEGQLLHAVRILREPNMNNDTLAETERLARLLIMSEVSRS